jgi:hypothetical protein
MEEPKNIPRDVRILISTSDLFCTRCHGQPEVALSRGPERESAQVQADLLICGHISMLRKPIINSYLPSFQII